MNIHLTLMFVPEGMFFRMDGLPDTINDIIAAFADGDPQVTTFDDAVVLTWRAHLTFMQQSNSRKPSIKRYQATILQSCSGSTMQCLTPTKAESHRAMAGYKNETDLNYNTETEIKRQRLQK